MSTIPATAATPTPQATYASAPPVPPSSGEPPAAPGSLGDRWKNWIKDQPEGVRLGIATVAGAAAGGLVGMVFGPVGGAVGAIAGGAFMFSFAHAMMNFT